MYDTIREADIDLLKEVLDALEEKYKEEEGKTNCLTSKLGCCSTNSEDELEANKSKSDQKEEETLIASLQELEDAHVHFARKTQPEPTKTSKHEELRSEIAEMNDRLGDLKREVKHEKRRSSPLWDTVNEEGETALHLTTSKKHFQPEATRMLLDVGANPNIQNSQGETALHNACSQGAIDEVTSLIEKGAGLVLNKKNEPPALENLFSENQDAEKINKMMAGIQKSTDKIKFFKKLFKEEKVHLTMIEKPDMLKALLETEEEADPDLVPFVNIQHEGNSPLHLAVEAKCHASASHLLRAGGYEMKPNAAAFTPAIEELFEEEKVAEITVHLVKGLICKAKMKLLRPDATINYLKMERPEGGCLLSLVEETSWWDELAATELVGVDITNFAARMPVEFSEWLVTKAAEEEKWDKWYVHRSLMEESKDGKSSYDRLNMVDTDSSGWDKVAAAVGVEIAQLAVNMPVEFSEWLLTKAAEEEEWDKRYVHRSLMEENKDGKSSYDRLNLVDMDCRGWNKVVAVAGGGIAQLAVNMPVEFCKWLLTKAAEEEWDKRKVHHCLMKENKDGKSSYDRLNLGDMDCSGWNKVAAGLFTELCHLGPFLVLFKRNIKTMKVFGPFKI